MCIIQSELMFKDRSDHLEIVATIDRLTAKHQYEMFVV